MLQAFFHAWERRLAAVTTDRVVRPFEWGLDWIPRNSAVNQLPVAVLRDWVSQVMTDTDAYFTPPPTTDYRLGTPEADGSRLLTFPSAFETPHVENNTVWARVFSARQSADRPRAAVVVLPHWNSDPQAQDGLCRLLTIHGISALRLSLPYHDRRMPSELHRADYIVSANVARTVQVCRQAVLDARRAVAWLASQGVDRIGILGSSLGSCLSLLTTAHEPLINAAALNHISPYFADVVWRGISTAHVREGLDGHIDLETLRELWRPINPSEYLHRLHGRRVLLVYAKYDLTFPVDLSRELVRQFEANGVSHEVAVLACGHYTTGKTPFKFVDGWILSRFLYRALVSGNRLTPERRERPVELA
jgi:pimeloyl-ACP methyl ester carboxylesterase